MGADAELFQEQWASHLRLAVTAASQFLNDAGQKLRFEAAQQREASSADAASAAQVGAMAGVAAAGVAAAVSAVASPSATLDANNRRLLANDIQQQKELLEKGGLSLAQLTIVVGTLTSLQGIEASLHGSPPRYLLQFDTNGPNGGHAVISIGNPDTAANVTTFVPGFGSTPAKIGDDLGYAQRIEDGVDSASGKQNATVVWMGYNAPQGFDVTSTDLAQQGAPALSTFLAGLKANNPDAHFVVEGHSYGSVLVGYAAQQPQGLSANDVILVGSPGTPATQATDFGVPNGHVFVGERGGDPVPAAGDLWDGGPNGNLPSGPLGYDPVNLPGVVHMDCGNDFNPFDNPLEKHSQYWDPGQPGLANQVAIISGRGKVTTTG